jgi:ribosomal-protein-alanine N-acetyltransferase
MAAERVEIEFPSLSGSFVGRLVSADRIEGFWLQNGQDHPLPLERGEGVISEQLPPRPISDEGAAGLGVEIGVSKFPETERLRFREVRASDIEDFERYMLTDHYLRHMPVDPEKLTKEYVAAQVNRHVRSQSQKPRTGFVAVAVDKASGQFVGESGLQVFTPTGRRCAAIGWGVIHNQAGKGFPTEIGRALLRFAFDTLNLHRVEAQCHSENLASRRIMTKLGMREEGIIRDNLLVRGEWWSTVQGAIISTDSARLFPNSRS